MNRNGGWRNVTRLDVRLTQRLGALLRKYRDGAGMTIRDVERATGIGFRSVAHWENGTREADVMRVAQLLALLRAYGVSLSQFEADLYSKRKVA